LVEQTKRLIIEAVTVLRLAPSWLYVVDKAGPVFKAEGGDDYSGAKA
jgi:hypothetical protein